MPSGHAQLPPAATWAGPGPAAHWPRPLEPSLSHLVNGEMDRGHLCFSCGGHLLDTWALGSSVPRVTHRLLTRREGVVHMRKVCSLKAFMLDFLGADLEMSRVAMCPDPDILEQGI